MTDTLPDDKTILIMARQFLSALPHCLHLNMQIVSADRTGVTVELPWSDQLIGNPESAMIHSGAVTTLMDTACGISTICFLPVPEVCPTLDLRIDHMMPPDPGHSIFATTAPFRVTRSIIFTRGVAWQDSPDNPVAHVVGAFMRAGGVKSKKAAREIAQ